MFSIWCYLDALYTAIPAVVLLGSAPNFCLLWCGWRACTAIMPNKVYQVGDDFLYSMYQRMVLFFLENYSGVQVVLYGDVAELKKQKENVILICNHQCTVDWAVANILAVRQSSIGHIRYILKNGLRWFPLYGFYFRQHSCIYVKRSGRFNQNQAEKQLQELVKNNFPFWMVIFPEGTRYNTENLKKSQKFAADIGKPVLNNVLTPRSKAVQLCVQHLRPNVDAVYDVTIGYSNTQENAKRIESPSLTEFFTGRSEKLHIKIKRIPINQIPSDTEKLDRWLEESFLEKEKDMTKFYSVKENESFGDGGKVDKLGLVNTLPSLLFFIAVGLPIFGTSIGRSIYWKFTVFGTLLGWSWMSVRQ